MKRGMLKRSFSGLFPGICHLPSRELKGNEFTQQQWKMVAIKKILFLLLQNYTYRCAMAMMVTFLFLRWVHLHNWVSRRHSSLNSSSSSSSSPWLFKYLMKIATIFCHYILTGFTTTWNSCRQCAYLCSLVLWYRRTPQEKTSGAKYSR